MTFVNFEEAVTLLKKEEVVAFPTETVYGLGAIATSKSAISKIYRAKQRPQSNPLILHVKDMNEASHYGVLTPVAYQLAKNLWPGPITLILPKKTTKIPCCATANLDTIAIRVPGHKQTLNLIDTVGQPLFAPSANPSGLLSPTSANHVQNLFQGKVPILKGEISSVGLESTIVDCTLDKPMILRQGGITENTIEKYINTKLLSSKEKLPIKAPGMSLRHYAPKLPLYLNRVAPEKNQAFITLGEKLSLPLPPGAKIFPLSLKANLEEAAKNLFSILHLVDNHTPKFNSIGVVNIPCKGIGKAINDRLSRGSYKEI